LRLTERIGLNITKIENKHRVVCEESWLVWWQDENPSLLQILKKVLEECGGLSQVVIEQLTPATHTSNQVFLFEIHNISITLVVNSYNFKTTMKSENTSFSWVEDNVDPSTLYIPYFKCFLINLRNVWYEQYKKDVGIN
jgi:hypothetical protein